jgi:ethanolaminephosphotransferase
MCGLCGLWLAQDCSVPFTCRLESIGVGVAYSLFASQLIMAHMCKEPFTAPGWAMVLVALAVINKALGIVDIMKFTLIVDGVLAVGYLHYVVVVIRQICAHLDIWCLTIKPKAA